MAAKPDAILRLTFDPAHAADELYKGLSAVVQIGRTVWVANDETISLERLTLAAGGELTAGEHVRFSLNNYLQLPEPPLAGGKKPKEIDLEGLAYDRGYLWLVGSHSCNRKKANPDKDGPDTARKNLEALVSDRSNRYLLARIPVVEHDGIPTLPPPEDSMAAMLPCDAFGNELTAAVKKDKQLRPFLDIGGKENGFDVEGLAAAGDRLFIGLRGPVLRGWALILEVHVTEEKSADGAPLLRLEEIGPGGRPYLKHFIQLGGLGVRDLCIDGNDLLILAGPTMDLDGPVAVLRWRDGTAPEGESMVSNKKLEPVLQVPFGQGEDHAEGIALFSPDGGEANSLLVVYDSASRIRGRLEDSSITADIFALPAPKG